MNNLIRMLEELIGQEARVEQQPFHPADMYANWANVEKARRLLNWEPQVLCRGCIQARGVVPVRAPLGQPGDYRITPPGILYRV